MRIFVVGNSLDDIFVKLDEEQITTEAGENGEPWLDLPFDSSTRQFSRLVTIRAGIANAEEIFLNLGHSIEPYPSLKDSRLIVSLKDHVTYFSPTKRRPTLWQNPNTKPDWVFIDPAARISQQTALRIASYLDANPTVRLAFFPEKNAGSYLKTLADRATILFLIPETKNFAEGVSKERLVVTIDDNSLSIGLNQITWQTQRKDLMTDLTMREIAASTFMGALLSKEPIETALNYVKLSIENASLNRAPSLSTLRNLYMNDKSSTTNLNLIAKMLVTEGKGILAADESGGSIHKKFEAANIPDTFEKRRDYRNIFFTTNNLEKYVNGIILFDETARQLADNGQNFTSFITSRGIIPGIKVDQGLTPIPEKPDENYTKGLDDLDERLKEYYDMGLRFAKWRAAFVVTHSTPSDIAIEKNCDILAEYAKKCQNNGIVPIVEPELVHDGNYSIGICGEYTAKILDCLFKKLDEKQVSLPATILKVNMVLAGSSYDPASTPEEVGAATVNVLEKHVPSSIAGVVFLSGGQTPEEATDNLQAITNSGPIDFPLTFSYARALQGPALDAWKGNDENADAARSAFEKRLIANCEALKKKE